MHIGRPAITLYNIGTLLPLDAFLFSSRADTAYAAGYAAAGDAGIIAGYKYGYASIAAGGEAGVVLAGHYEERY